MSAENAVENIIEIMPSILAAFAPTRSVTSVSPRWAPRFAAIAEPSRLSKTKR